MNSQRTPRIEIFSGWKDIASYMGKGVRTVQRYERKLKLPIRRPAGKTKGAVLAFKAEIDGWVKTSPVREGLGRSVHATENGAILSALTQETVQTSRLRQETRRLRHQTVQFRKELTAARQELRATTKSLYKSLGRGVAEEDQIERLSSTRHRTADVLIFDPKKKVN